MYGPTWPFLLMYGSHDMRDTGFRRLTVVNRPPGFLGRHKFCENGFRLESTRVVEFTCILH